MKPMRVAAFTQGENVPSARFRVRQHIAALAELDVQLEEFPARHGSYPPAGLWPRLRWLPATFRERLGALRAASECDVAMFQREMMSTLPSAEYRWRKPAVFDVDDAIWLDQRFGAAARIARHCGFTICGNAFLAEWFSRHSTVEIIPTAVDTLRYVPGERSETPLLVWSGSSSGHAYLEMLQPVLARLMARLPTLRLRIISNAPPALAMLPQERVEQWAWSPANEVLAMQSAWAGLMPMPDTLWTRGKCSYKMLCYMACGVPAVVSPHGMNAEVLRQGEGALGAGSDEEWQEHLLSLLHDRAAGVAMGLAGRRLVEAHYSNAVIAPRLAACLRSRV